MELEGIDMRIKDELVSEVLDSSNKWRSSIRNYVTTFGMDNWIHDLILMHIEQTAGFTWKHTNNNTKAEY